MKTIEQEYEKYLKEVAATYPKATVTVLQQPSSLSGLGDKIRDFDNKAKSKIEELIAQKPKLNPIDIRAALAPIYVRIHGDVVLGHL